MRLRPYKSYDAKKIISWIKDEEVFLKWGGDHFGLYPISAEIIDNKYLNDKRKITSILGLHLQMRTALSGILS